MNRSKRKWEHIQYALAAGQAETPGFDDLQFAPNSLPNISYGNISLQVRLGDWELSSPIIVNAMTGGSKETAEINRKLAEIARELKLAMAVGSQMAAVREPDLEWTFKIAREVNSAGLIFANLGAEATVEQAKRAVEMIAADALQIHLNVMQELLMPEGDRDFTGYLLNIERLARSLSVPLIVKEVGFGMTRKTIRQLADAGVRLIDVGGKGGTNFARVENCRRDRPLSMFEDWGLTTVQSLMEADCSKTDGVAFIASGGIRHGLHIAKALALGAGAAGLAGRFLRMVQTLPLEGCLAEVDELHHQLRIAMTALGAADVLALRAVPVTIGGETRSWARQRGIDCQRYAARDMDVCTGE
ncbi:type 2 isopentenyl-diphosphate Delta-isomerase [Brevibacillus massiliensis]|uniref:type 2 isopentenyl-diphosphate Delta-isomerase n=1 Tax=Brevibacillus massiliensis TaxID=1118054 RepID=UPI0003047295|nr:type 2 isopentenyl-diphosphate Delta-isomerase [Brevibacillus massiliensis]